MAAVGALQTSQKARGTVAANSVAYSWSVVPSPFQKTEVYTTPKDDASTLVSAEPPRVTALDAKNRAGTLLSGPLEQLPAAGFAMTPGIRRVDAVVGEIMRDTVVVRCMFASGRVDINLPPSLFPPDLLNFGMPIRISLDDSSGIRTPIIESRPIDAQPKLPGQDEVEAWLDTL